MNERFSFDKILFFGSFYSFSITIKNGDKKEFYKAHAGMVLVGTRNSSQFSKSFVSTFIEFYSQNWKKLVAITSISDSFDPLNKTHKSTIIVCSRLKGNWQMSASLFSHICDIFGYRSFPNQFSFVQLSFPI